MSEMTLSKLETVEPTFTPRPDFPHPRVLSDCTPALFSLLTDFKISTYINNST